MMTYTKQVTSPNVHLRWNRFLSGIGRYVLREVRVRHCDAGTGKHEVVCLPDSQPCEMCDTAHSPIKCGAWVVVSRAAIDPEI